MSERIGRNELCYCGSGKKFKRCCMARPAASIARPGDGEYQRAPRKIHPQTGRRNHRYSSTDLYLAATALLAMSRGR